MTKPSPWSDEGYCDHVIAESFSEATDQMRALSARLPAMDEDERRAVIELVYWAMDYGWQESLRNGPTAPWRASRRAVAKRATAKTSRHAQIVAAADDAARHGRELDIAGIAKQFGVSASTVYRALQNGTKKT